MMIEINLPKAKQIAHVIRKGVRAENFKQLDIEATIPDLAEAAEASRQVIRDRDAVLQVKIDAAATAEELKLLLPTPDEV